MKDSDIKRLIEKLKEDKIGYVIDALKELYDAAVMGEDISAATELLVSTCLEKDDIDAVAEMLKYLPGRNKPKPFRLSSYPSRDNFLFGFSEGYNPPMSTGELGAARNIILEMLREYLEKKGLPSIVDSFSYPKVRDTAMGLLNKFVHEGIDISPAVPALFDLLNSNQSVMDIMHLLEKHADNLAKDGKYFEALKVTKDIVSAVKKLYEGRRDRESLRQRRQLLIPSESLVQKIHNKMNPDKKKFPVKRQDVRRQEAVKKPLKALHMK